MAAVADSGAHAIHSTTWSCSRNSILHSLVLEDQTLMVLAMFWRCLQITDYLPIRLLLPLLLLLPLPLSEQASFMAAVADSGAQTMHSTTWSRSGSSILHFLVSEDKTLTLIWLYLQITDYLPIRLLLPLLLLLPLPLSEQASFMAAVADSGAHAMHSTTWSCLRSSNLHSLQ